MKRQRLRGHEELMASSQAVGADLLHYQQKLAQLAEKTSAHLQHAARPAPATHQKRLVREGA